MNLGYIGLGLMGIPCAYNLLKAGHSVRIWSRRPAVAAPLVQKGARLSPDIASLASSVDILILNVRQTSDVEEILLDPGGVNENANPGLVVMDMSTISYLSTRRLAQILAERGVELVDAPVSGDTNDAEKGTLTFMVGAKESTFERLKPLFSAMGSKATLVGPSGAGQVAQGCNQILVSATLAALGESMKFAKQGEVDFAAVREALAGGDTTSPILQRYTKHILSDNFAPGFKTELHCKDMALVKSIAAQQGFTLPFSRMIYDLLRKAVLSGHGEEDSSVVAKLMAESQEPRYY